MKIPRLYSTLLLAATLAAGSLGTARAEDPATTVKFSDAGKPGILKVIVAHGDLRIIGADTQEVSVRSDAKVVNKPRKDGLRVLTSSSSFMLSEKDNIVTLDAQADGWGGGASDFRITVPRATSVVVQGGWGGDITCTNLAGNIDIKSTNGEIRLDEIAGGVTVETANGEIRANIRELHQDKPLSFTSTNGEIVLRVPDTAKANIRLRTQNGAVLTDFDEKVLVTKTETTTRVGNPRNRGPKGMTMTIGINGDKLREAARGLEIKAREIAAEASRSGANADHVRAEADKMRAEADKMRAEADKMRTEGEKIVRVEASLAPPAPPAASASASASSSASASASAAPAAPPAPAQPTITGGKLVTGTLNGGGPEISVSTMNGDVTLRQLEKK